MDDQEIYLLITRYLTQQTTLDENEKLTDWIAQSKEKAQTDTDGQYNGLFGAGKQIALPGNICCWQTAGIFGERSFF